MVFKVTRLLLLDRVEATGEFPSDIKSGVRSMIGSIRARRKAEKREWLKWRQDYRKLLHEYYVRVTAAQQADLPPTLYGWRKSHRLTLEHLRARNIT